MRFGIDFYNGEISLTNLALESSSYSIHSWKSIFRVRSCCCYDCERSIGIYLVHPRDLIVFLQGIVLVDTLRSSQL
jgi:hypothetical protein